MKKATKKEAAAPVNLGTKRTCPKCSTRFYDFAKEEIVCPKCEVKLDPEALNPLAKLNLKAKSAPAARVADEEDVVPVRVAGESEDVIESVDDLGDDEEEIVEDLVEDDADEEEY